MKLDKMTKQKIDEFFDSKTPEELKYLWQKYDKYSEENLNSLYNKQFCGECDNGIVWDKDGLTGVNCDCNYLKKLK